MINRIEILWTCEENLDFMNITIEKYRIVTRAIKFFQQVIKYKIPT